MRGARNDPALHDEIDGRHVAAKGEERKPLSRSHRCSPLDLLQGVVHERPRVLSSYCHCCSRWTGREGIALVAPDGLMALSELLATEAAMLWLLVLCVLAATANSMRRAR